MCRVMESIVVESSYGPKNFALNDFRQNFPEAVTNANKVIAENLVAVR